MKHHSASWVAAGALIYTVGAGCAYGDDFTGAARDAWIAGKLEGVYALNRHLNPFEIDTNVDDGVVRLTGTVESDIDRDLAGELAKGIEGVLDVDNDLKVEPETRAAAENRSSDDGQGERSFGVWVDDATTTAVVKSKLVANPNTEGLDIKVETRGDVVTLTGAVGSDQEKQLAEEIARNTGDVEKVRNELVVRDQG